MNWRILYKYIEGRCNEEELRQVGDWLKEDPANEDFFTSFIEEWDEKENYGVEEDVQAAWNDFRKQKMQSAADSETPDGSEQHPSSKKECEKIGYSSKTQKRTHNSTYWTYSVAAAILLIFAVLFVIRRFEIASYAEQQTGVTYQEILTSKGQRTNLQLSDGTKVVLNSSSRLRIPKKFGQQTRTVYLKGEAFFDVEHDADNPFIVISNRAYAKDLGTRFNVMAYDTSGIEVAVEEGLVSLGKVEQGSPQKGIVELTPNKVGTLKEIGGLTVSDIENIDSYTGWTEGKLVFRKTPFPEVIKRLERWFDIDCRVETPGLDERTLTATYNNMQMGEVLKVLSLSMNITYTRKGHTVIFRNRED